MTEAKRGDGALLPDLQLVTAFDADLFCPQCEAKMTKANGRPSHYFDSPEAGWGKLARAHCAACDIYQDWGVWSPANPGPPPTP